MKTAVNIEAAKISPLSSGKIDKYEYRTGEKIISSNQSQIIEHAKFTISPLGKAFEKQNKTKTIKDVAEKQTEALQTLNTNQQLKSIGSLFLKYFFNKKS